LQQRIISLLGLLPALEDVLMRNMRVFSVSDNQLTGTIYPSLSNMPSLILFSINTNCFSGTIPAGICQNTEINELIMDGLSAASVCQQKLFPFIPKLYLILVRTWYGWNNPCLFLCDTTFTFFVFIGKSVVWTDS
jgi:hypothetical protein